jgi:3-oxoacyl-[acyl-carrier-protein] synthase II
MVAAHATSTPNNDAAEFSALRAVFGEGLARVPIVAFKSHLGHTLGGAGAAELVLSALSLRDGVVPPTANVTPEQVEFPGLSLNTAGISSAQIDATLNLSLGFGGANSCAILSHSSTTDSTSDAHIAREVFITGVGVVAPSAVGNAACASLLAKAPPPLLADPGALNEAAIAHLLQARRVRRMSDYVKMTLASAAVALEDAGVDDIPSFGRDCAAMLGTTHGSAAYSEAYYRQIVAEGIVGANPMLFAEGVPNAGAAQLSMMFQIKGPCQTIIGSRTAGLDALWLAALRISAGQWDRAIVGAAEEYCGVVNDAYARHSLYASGEAIPFSGSGFRAGACGVAIVLESAESVRARGGRVRGAVERGRSVAGAGPFGVARAAALALMAAGSPDHVLCSASGSWLDRAEAIGIAASRRGRAPTIAATIAGYLGETFSTGPLAALAGVLLTNRLPIAPTGSACPRSVIVSGGVTAPRSIGVLCTDWWGSASALSIRSERQRTPTSGCGGDSLA